MTHSPQRLSYGQTKRSPFRRYLAIPFALLVVFLTMVAISMIRFDLSIRRQMDQTPYYPLSAAADIASIAEALRSFRTDCGRYPTTDEGLDILKAESTSIPGWKGPYIMRISTFHDPWGVRYHYGCPGKHDAAGFDVYSAGPDKTPGTEDDVVSWKR